MQDVRRSRSHAFAKGTTSNLRTQFRSYFNYCVYFHREPLPADLNTICGFAQFLSRSLKPQSIRNYLSGVKLLHILSGYEYVFSEDFHLRLTLRGISRLHPHVPKRAKPITPTILRMFYEKMDQNDSLHCTVYACSLLLFFTMARLGSVLPSTVASTPAKSHLTRDCINFSKEGMLVTFIHTKTIQFGLRRLHIPLVTLGSLFCPVVAFKRSLSFLKSSHVAAFVSRDEQGHYFPLTKSTFINTFRDVLLSAGQEDITGFTGHSFRRGGASWAFQSGMPGELIQVCGDWTSDAYTRYLEFNMSNKIELAALFARKLKNI